MKLEKYMSIFTQSYGRIPKHLPCPKSKTGVLKEQPFDRQNKFRNKVYQPKDSSLRRMTITK